MQEAGSGAKEFLPRYHPDDPHGGSLVVIPGNGDGPSRSSRAAPEWPVPFACRGLSPSPLAAGRLRQFAPSARLTEIFYHNLSACQGRLGTIRRKAWNHPAEALCEKTSKKRLTSGRQCGNITKSLRNSAVQPLARVVELVDSLASGASARKGVRVRLPPRAPARRKRHIVCDEFFMLRIKNSSRTHSAALRFRIGFACAGFRFGAAALRRFCFISRKYRS